jgi:hypothetical protein
MNWMLRTLWLLLLSQCKPWLPLLAAGPQQEAINFQVQDTVQPPIWISTPPVVNPLPYEHLIPLPEYHWQPQFISNQPFFTVSLPDPKIDSLRKVVDSMAGLQRAQLRQDSLLRVQLKQQQEKFSSLRQAHEAILQERSWFRAASMALGAFLVLGLIWVRWRYRVRASP